MRSKFDTGFARSAKSPFPSLLLSFPPFCLAASVSWCWSWEKEGRGVEVAPGIYIYIYYKIVHWVQHKLNRKSRSECRKIQKIIQNKKRNNMDYYSLADPGGMEDWVGHVGWPIADGITTKWSPFQLAVWRRIGKVRRPRPAFYPLCYINWVEPSKIRSISELQPVSDSVSRV